MATIKLLHMYPNMLDLYGDSGNVEIIKYRCKKRGIDLEVFSHVIGDDTSDFSQYDIVYLGGGADLEQQILADDLLKCRDAIKSAYDKGTFFLMICGGYQLMGQYYKDSNGEKIPGLALFDYYTVASTDKGKRYLKEHKDDEKIRLIHSKDVTPTVPLSVDYYTYYPNPETKEFEVWPDRYEYDIQVHKAIKPFLQ